MVNLELNSLEGLSCNIHKLRDNLSRDCILHCCFHIIQVEKELSTMAVVFIFQLNFVAISQLIQEFSNPIHYFSGSYFVYKLESSFENSMPSADFLYSLLRLFISPKESLIPSDLSLFWGFIIQSDKMVFVYVSFSPAFNKILVLFQKLLNQM